MLFCKFETKFYKKDLESNNTVIVLDTNVIIAYSWMHLDSEIKVKKDMTLEPDYMNMIKDALVTKKVQSCKRILREVNGILYKKCNKNQKYLDEVLEKLKLNHPDTAISDIAADIQNNVILEGSANYPMMSKEWPIEIIEDIYQDIKDNYPDKLKEYKRKKEKKPFDNGDVEILTYCAYLSNTNKKKVLLFTNDRGITTFSRSICSRIKNLTIITQYPDV